MAPAFKGNVAMTTKFRQQFALFLTVAAKAGRGGAPHPSGFMPVTIPQRECSSCQLPTHKDMLQKSLACSNSVHQQLKQAPRKK